MRAVFERFGGLALICAGVCCFCFIAVAVVYFQNTLGLSPCPLCVVQRMAYFFTGAFAVASGLALSFGARKTAGVTAAVAAAFAAAGMTVAGRQTAMVWNPSAAACEASFEEIFLEGAPWLARAWPSMFEADGICSEVAWTFAGRSIPELSFVAFFSLFALLAVSSWLAFSGRAR